MKRKFILPLLLFLALTQGAHAECRNGCGVKDFATVQAVANTGLFTVHGFVISTYTCPPCPEGAMCEPCAPDSITIADSMECKAKQCETLRLATKDKSFKIGHEVEAQVEVRMEVRTIEDAKRKRETKALLSKDPELMNTNPAKWFQKNYPK